MTPCIIKQLLIAKMALSLQFQLNLYIELKFSQLLCRLIRFAADFFGSVIWEYCAFFWKGSEKSYWYELSNIRFTNERKGVKGAEERSAHSFCPRERRDALRCITARLCNGVDRRKFRLSVLQTDDALLYGLCKTQVNGTDTTSDYPENVIVCINNRFCVEKREFLKGKKFLNIEFLFICYPYPETTKTSKARSCCNGIVNNST